MYVIQGTLCHTTARQVTVCGLVLVNWNGESGRGLWTNIWRGLFIVTHKMSQHLLTSHYCSTS